MKKLGHSFTKHVHGKNHKALLFVLMCFTGFLLHAAESGITPNDVFQNPSDYNAWNVSIDGKRALLGAYKFGNNGNNVPGRAYIYEYENNQWIEKASLRAADGVGDDGFGVQVNITGNTALVGAASLTQENTPGSVYVFEFNNNQWTQAAKLQASDGSGANNFGRAISNNTQQIFIGAQTDSESGFNAGAVYVFNKINSVWTETNKLTSDDIAPLDFFGASLSSYGNKVAVGAFGDQGGSAYVFKLNSGQWSQEAKLIANDRTGLQLFGKSISMSNDLIIVGAPSDHERGTGSGAAYIFSQAGGWSQAAKLIGSSTTTFDNFGTSVGINGNYALIGALSADSNVGNNSGESYLFKRTGSNWSQTELFSASNSIPDHLYGASVAISSNWIFIGTDMLTTDLAQSNAAYIYDANTATPVENINQAWVNGLGEINDNQITVATFTTSGGAFGNNFDPTAIETSYWGVLYITFTGCHSAEMKYASLIMTENNQFGKGGYPIQRIATNQISRDCETIGFENTTDKQWMSGTFFGGADRNGEGFTVDVLNDNSAIVTWFTYMPES